MQDIVVKVASLLLAITFHEAAHAWMAFRFGDPTAKQAGRLTLNPLPHIDPLGTVILPLLLILMQAPVLIGWAKPVPVNPLRFRNQKKGFTWVSIAGPGSNMLLAALSALAIKIWTLFDPSLLYFLTGETAGGMKLALPLFLFLWMSVKINVVLGVFNLLPIPPLDGGHFLVGLLPPRQSWAFSRIEPFGMLIILLLVYLGLLDMLVWPISKLFIGLFLW